MDLARRRFLRLAGAAIAGPLFHALPSRKRIRPGLCGIIGFGAGSSSDIKARLIGEWLSRTARPAIHDRKPAWRWWQYRGRGGVRAPADGYTLLVVAAANAVSATLYEKRNFDLVRDIAPVAGIVHGPQVMEVNPSFPAKTVSELIAYAKSQSRQDQHGIDRDRKHELMWRASSSRRWPVSTWCTCHIAARRQRSATLSAARCMSCSIPCLRRSGTSGLADCDLSQ